MRTAGSHWAAEWSGTNDWHSRAADAGEINCLHFEILAWPLQPTFQDYLDICCVGLKKLINPCWPKVWQTVPTAALVSGWWAAGQLRALLWLLSEDARGFLRNCVQDLYTLKPGGFTVCVCVCVDKNNASSVCFYYLFQWQKSLNNAPAPTSLKALFSLPAHWLLQTVANMR